MMSCVVHGRARGGYVKILVVDDFAGTGEMASMLLQALGHESRFALSGKAALAEVAAFDPDVVILDIGLPDIDGFAVARAIRARPRATPVFLASLSGWEAISAAPADTSDVFHLHVMKPANLERIQRLLEAAARFRDAAGSGARPGSAP